VRAYAAVEGMPSSEAQIEGFRRITLKLLASREPRLASSAVRDIALATSTPLIGKADMPLLTSLLADDRVAIGTRVALLAELEQRRLVSGPTEWVKLLRETTGNDLLIVVRALAAHPSAPVTQALLPMLESRDEAVAAAAAVSLGSPGNQEAIGPLVRLLGRDDQRLRMAAIRGLGRIGTPESRRALELAAAFHPDQATRRRANAEVIVLARRQGTTLGPTIGRSLESP
jgi:HEAT repeat protein